MIMAIIYPICDDLKSGCDSNSVEAQLGLKEVACATILVLLILLTILGNILVVLSVCFYQRMRTFTNILLISLATSDLLLGLVVMPLSLANLIYNRIWPFGRILCALWATFDVLLCTASILNLCIISIDRYMAIINPLKYPRARSRKIAAGLASIAWILSVIICSPPWLLPGWGIFQQYGLMEDESNQMNSSVMSQLHGPFSCSYPVSVAYRIYSALGSFYLPLLVMLFVYYRIFRVTSKRELCISQSMGTIRFSNCNDQNVRQHVTKCLSVLPVDIILRRSVKFAMKDERTLSGHQIDLCTMKKAEACPIEFVEAMDCFSEFQKSPRSCQVRAMDELEVEQKNEINVHDSKMNDDHDEITQQKHQIEPHRKRKSGRYVRQPKERTFYMRERRALKTIAIVVFGFTICWMPFFVLYLIEVFFYELAQTKTFTIASEFFLWLGYSNSALNPIIYTTYNSDFRRCFRDLLSFGCFVTHTRTMSVKKLHQRSTVI